MAYERFNCGCFVSQLAEPCCILVHFIFAASALKCYQCTSTTSMSDCESNKKETECSSGQDRCGKASFEYKVASVETKAYGKGCGTKAECDSGSAAFKACKKIEGATCEFDCCSGDLCNGGAAPVISVFVMVAGALVALFR